MMVRTASSLKRMVTFSSLFKFKQNILRRSCQYSSAVGLGDSTSSSLDAVFHSKNGSALSKDHINIDKKPWWEEASIYVHWPYCQKRCTYCNFNKYVVPRIDQERMKRCLVTELRTLVQLSSIKSVNSVFFGGGTPSLAEPDVLRAVIDAIRETVAMPTDCEITMEANPTSVEMEKLSQFKIAGINRLSLGIQALNTTDLGMLGRDHTLDQSLICIREARALFPRRLSIDIIFGRPGQTLQSWSDELDQVLDVCDDHISLYQLTLEPGTQLYKMANRGLLSMPDSDLIAEMYEMATGRLNGAGFRRYEVSNFARTVSAESSHNKCYWEGKQYIGIGPGAHGRFCPVVEQREFFEGKGECQSDGFHKSDAGHSPSDPVASSKPTSNNPSQSVEASARGILQSTQHIKTESIESAPQREARIQTLAPDAWMREVERHGHATRKRVVQSRTDVVRELLLTGLRVPQGIGSTTWEKFMPGFSLLDTFGESEFLKEVVDSGLMELDSDGLRCLGKGLNLLDSLLPNLVEHLTVFCERNSIK